MNLLIRKSRELDANIRVMLYVNSDASDLLFFEWGTVVTFVWIIINADNLYYFFF